jgi:hypothetical protein
MNFSKNNQSNCVSLLCQKSSARFAGATALLFLSLPSVYAQTGTTPIKSDTTKTTTVLPSSTPVKWEYLVISFGKAQSQFFGSDSITKIPSLSSISKIMAYSPTGLVDPAVSEAVWTQKQMDILGRFGWELVGTMAMVGGEIPMIFKRPYDSEKTKKEFEIIQIESEKLIDLDELDLKKETTSNKKEFENLITKIVKSVDQYKILELSPILESSDLFIKDKHISATIGAIITIDATDILLQDGNKYRKSVARKLVEDAGKLYVKAITNANPKTNAKDTLIRVSVIIAIRHNGKIEKLDL